MTPFYIILALVRCCSIQGAKKELCNAGEKNQCPAYLVCKEDVEGKL
jgi:hypothetical protein